MLDSRLAALRRDLGVEEARSPARDLQQAEAVKRVIDPTGALIREAVMPLIPAQVLSWGTRLPVDRAGRLTLIRAIATTAPSSGDATISVIQETQAGGEETIASIRIPQGQRFSDPDTMTGADIEVPKGAWLDYTVDANGASGIDVSVRITTMGGA